MEARPSGGGTRIVALGFAAYLDAFAAKHAAETITGITKDDSLNWRFIFLEMLADGVTLFLFNLTGMEQYALNVVSRVASNRSTLATEWELANFRGQRLLGARYLVQRWIARSVPVYLKGQNHVRNGRAPLSALG